MSRLRLAIIDERGGSSLTPHLVERLRGSLPAQAAENAGRLVTLEGGPDAFCTGMDPEALAELGTSSAAREALDRFATLLDAIERVPCPVVALVDGKTTGGGVGLAAAADLVLATPRATFSLPETLLGLIPAMIFPVLARRIGVPRARWLALGAATLSATEAHRIGLVDQVAEDLESALDRCARRLLRMDPRALAEIKRLVAEHHGVSESYRSEATERFGRLLESRETRSRLARFAVGEAPWPDDPDSAMEDP